MRGEESAHVAVQALDLGEFAVERHGERGLAVAYAVRLELDQRAAEPVRLDRRGRIHHRRRRALGLLHVRHHRVAAREVVALCAPDPAPCGFHRPWPPLERGAQHGVETVELPEQVRVRLAGRREERAQDHRLAVETEVRAFRLELREREPPIHAAPPSRSPWSSRT